MKFDEQTAKELQVKNNLTNSVINKWRFRDSIPESYFTKKDTAKEKSNEIVCSRIVSAFGHGFMNRAVMCKLIGIFTKQTYSGQFSEFQIIAVKKELNRLKIDIANAFEEKSERKLKSILSDERIFVKVLMKDVESVYYHRALALISKNTSIDDQTFFVIKDCFVKAALTLSI